MKIEPGCSPFVLSWMATASAGGVPNYGWDLDIRPPVPARVADNASARNWSPSARTTLRTVSNVGSRFPDSALLEALAGKAGVACHLRHASSAGDVAQRLGHERGVAVRLLDRRLEIRRHVLARTQVLGNVVR